MSDLRIPINMPGQISRRDRAALAGLADSKVIENRTSRRIGIAFKPNASHTVASNATPSSCISLFTLPPFGKQILARAELRGLQCDDWERLRLITIKDYRPTRRTGAVLGDVANYLIGGGLLALMAYPIQVLSSSTWFWACLIGFIALIMLVGIDGLWTTIQNFVSASFIYVVVEAIGFMLPIVLFDAHNSLASLTIDDWFKIGCIGIAATLPAILFYLFYGQGLRTLRENFIRNIIHIDPNVRTIDEAEEFYGKMVDDTVGTRHGHLPFTGHVMVLLSTALFVIGWSFILPIERARPISQLFGEVRIDPMIFGFLGAYFYSVHMAFRRYTRADINAKTYAFMAVRVLLAVTVAWALTKVAQWGGPPGAPAPGEIWIDILAFGIGVCPELIDVVVREFIQSQRWLDHRLSIVAQQHRLRSLHGMSLHDQSRLLEEGVENIEHLVHHSPIDLLLHTRIPAPHLIDLIDQAILYLHATNCLPAGQPGAAIGRLHMVGIRTATQLEYAAHAAEARGGTDYVKFLGLLDSLEPSGPAQRIRRILDTLLCDEQMVFVRQWSTLHRTSDQLFTEDDLTQLAGMTHRQQVAFNATAHRSAPGSAASAARPPAARPRGHP